MGKSEILLLIASVAIGIALMIGMVVPIIKDGKDMVETRNLAQEMSAVKDKFTSNQVMKTYNNGDIIKVGGTNFLEANTGSDKAAYPYKAKTTGARYSNITYNISGSDKTGTFAVNLADTNAAKIDFEDSEGLKTICDKTMTLASNVITCIFKAE